MKPTTHDDTKSDESRTPMSETIVRQSVPRYTLDPKSVGCYTCKAEVDEAIANGTYDVNKTQYYDRKRRRQYFLVYQ